MRKLVCLILSFTRFKQQLVVQEQTKRISSSPKRPINIKLATRRVLVGLLRVQMLVTIRLAVLVDRLFVVSNAARVCHELSSGNHSRLALVLERWHVWWQIGAYGLVHVQFALFP